MRLFGRRGVNGFTALEVLIATGMLLTLVMILVLVLSTSVDSHRSLTLQSHVQHENRVALDVLRNAIAPGIGVNPLDSAELFVDVFTVDVGEFDAAADTNGNGLRDAGEDFDDADADGLYDGPIDVVLIMSANALREEPFTDADGDGVYDAGELFTDFNGDGVWTDANGNGMFDEAFRTYSFPMNLAGEPDAHSMTIFAPFTTAEGHRQLRQYTVYRTETDLDGDGQFANSDTDGDGVPDMIEDELATTGLAWDPPYVINEVNTDSIVLRDKTGDTITVDRETGTIGDSAPHTPPRVVCNSLHSFDIALDVDARQSIMVNVQLTLLTNVESFNLKATGKGRVYSTLTTGVWMNN